MLVEALGNPQSRKMSDSWASLVKKFPPTHQEDAEDIIVIRVLVMMAGQRRSGIIQIMDSQDITQIRTTIWLTGQLVFRNLDRRLIIQMGHQNSRCSEDLNV